MATRPVGKVRSPVFVIVITIITLGIYHLYWYYQLFKDNKAFAGEGIGGPLGLVIGIIPLVNIVDLFLLPSEVGNLYAREGQGKPVRGVTAFWTLIPLVGFIIWVVKVQGALNRFWVAHGARAA